MVKGVRSGGREWIGVARGIDVEVVHKYPVTASLFVSLIYINSANYLLSISIFKLILSS